MKIINKDITTIDSGLLLHGCNCLLAYGSGVAGAIRRKWIDAYESFIEFSKSYDTPKERLGKVDFVSVTSTVIVANGFTQLEFGADGKRYADPKAIESVLKETVKYALEHKLQVYMPRIGCGLGGLDWIIDVKPIIENIEKMFNIEIIICDYTP